MGIYDEYLNQSLSLPDLNTLRWEQLARISRIRKRDVLTFAADLRKAAIKAPIGIDYGDILPFSDRLENLSGSALDLILETPGGSGEVAEDLVRIARARYEDLAVIVPGWAKSAGTIMTMAADDIVMGTTSALGPIDAQLAWQGKVFSADALIKGFEDIKADIDDSGVLSKAYIPILQNLSPGELKEAHNQLEFAKALVTSWLAQHKFRRWTEHSSSGKRVTKAEREERARQVAEGLCDHTRWRTHGKSLRIDDLRDLGLKVTDYSADSELNDAITRYYTLLQMVFDTTNIYKIWEIPQSWIVRSVNIAGQPAPPMPEGATKAALQVQCPSCKRDLRIQANLDTLQPLDAGMLPYPEGDMMKCPDCGADINLVDVRRKVELGTRRKVVPFREESS